MRTREKSYDDYGFAPGEEKRLKELCREKNFKTYILIHLAARKACPDMAEDIAYSLLKGLSYEKILFIHSLPISKNDFYAYRRKCLYFFKRMSE